MQIPVLIEPLTGNGFCARAGEPLSMSAEGATQEEALAKLRCLLDRQLRNGKQLVALDVRAQDNPWLAIAGMHDPNDSLVREWKEEMAAYRQEMESDPNYP